MDRFKAYFFIFFCVLFDKQRQTNFGDVISILCSFNKVLWIIDLSLFAASIFNVVRKRGTLLPLLNWSALILTGFSCSEGIKSVMGSCIKLFYQNIINSYYEGLNAEVFCVKLDCPDGLKLISPD